MVLVDIPSRECLAAALPRLRRPSPRFVFATNHPCVPTTGTDARTIEAEHEGGPVLRHTLEVRRHPTSASAAGVAILGQPARATCVDRPLGAHITPFCVTGMLLDGLVEPVEATPAVAHAQAALGDVWHGIRPVLVARLRPTGSECRVPAAAQPRAPDAPRPWEVTMTEEPRLVDHGHYEDLDLTGADLSGLALVGAVFVRCRLVRCVLSESRTTACRFEDSNLAGARLGGSVHRESAFLNCDLAGAGLFQSRFVACKMVGSHFDGVVWAGSRIEGGDWSLTDLRGARWPKAGLKAIRLAEADLSGADLREADLRQADLSRATLAGADLAGADLRGARLEGVDFRAVTLRGAHLDSLQAVLVVRSLGARVDAPWEA
jgi:uncharacterized protein YjbI with pentapeptide repeats